MDYYGRLERGQLAGASEAVLDAVARALRLDDAERQHLFDLARTSGATRRPARRPKPSTPRPAVLAILASMTSVPAYLRNARLDVIAANDLCQALYDGTLDDHHLPLNLARYLGRRASESLSPERACARPFRACPTGCKRRPAGVLPQ